MPELRTSDRQPFYSVAHAAHTAWSAGSIPTNSSVQQALARFLNLPCHETFVVLEDAWPAADAYRDSQTAIPPEALREQWDVHHTLLEKTWKRLCDLGFSLSPDSQVDDALRHLRLAGIEPKWWRRRSRLHALMYTRYEAFRCVYDRVCIQSADAELSVYTNSFGIPCDRSEADTLSIHLICPEFSAQGGQS